MITDKIGIDFEISYYGKIDVKYEKENLSVKCTFGYYTMIV